MPTQQESSYEKLETMQDMEKNISARSYRELSRADMCVSALPVSIQQRIDVLRPSNKGQKDGNRVREEG